MRDFTMRFVFDRKNETGFKKKVKGKTYKETGLLQIEVKQDGTDKRAYVSTGIKVTPDQISISNVLKIKNHDNAKSLTGKARNRFNEVEAFVSSDRCMSITDVQNWNKADMTSLSVIAFIKAELIRRNVSSSVLEYNNSFLRRLEEFDKINTFKDITYQNIVEFDSHLRKTINSEPTLYKRHSLFKGYIQEAINRGLFQEMNPYNIFKIKKGKSKDAIFLTESEIKKIEHYYPDYGYLERTKDLYLFQCFTGLAYIDLMHFNKDYIQEMEDCKVIRSNRTKTDESFITLFLPEAQKIAEKYNYSLPKITNQKYNEYLKEIAINAAINKPLVSHSARHTFATYLLNKGIPIETVSRALGHSNIKQTQRYARLLGKKVISDMKALL